MTNLILALLPIGMILVVSELLWRKQVLFGERGRKFIHILAGMYIAFWPNIIPSDGIAILGLMALVFLLYSRRMPIFHAVYTKERKTYGELFFALAIILCALYAKEPWIFTTAILFLAAADGAAAVFGKLYGTNNTYAVFGSRN
jgi:phytol kinase